MDAVIVGAGHAGIAVSQQLAERDVEHVVLERGRVGESWRSGRWDSFTLNTPSWMNGLPGEGESHLAQPVDAFISRDELVERLERYADDWDLPVRQQTGVKRVEHIAANGKYRVHLEDDAGPPIDCHALIVASGGQNEPRVPPISSAMPSSVLQLPALGYRRADQLPSGGVLVVGGGQTGGQLVEELLGAGREVYWSVSAVTRIPRRYRGREIMEWLVQAGFFAAPLESIADPAILRAAQPIISGVGRYGHTLSLQWLAGKGATLLGRITSVEGSVLFLDDSVEASIRFADGRSREVCAEIDKGIMASGMDLPPLEPDEADEPVTDFEQLRSPDRLDLDAAGVRTIIWATGVIGDFSYLPQGATTDGTPRHTHGAAELPGLDFIGLPWLTHRSSGIIGGIVKDAEMVAQRVANRINA